MRPAILATVGADNGVLVRLFLEQRPYPGDDADRHGDVLLG
jgi:hypothetical protein